MTAVRARRRGRGGAGGGARGRGGALAAALATGMVAAMVLAACTAPDNDDDDDNTTTATRNEASAMTPIGAESYGTIADRIAEYADAVAAQAQIPAVAIGIITPDGLVEDRYLGVNHAGAPVSADTVFEIGSATKAFLGVTQAMLVERGDLAWDDRVVDHYPDFRMYDPWVTREFRIDDLLAQRSGLPTYAGEPMSDFGFPWASNLELLADIEPVSSFRSTFAYQNMPHFVAGEIVADKVGAEDWNAAAEELLFEPLGMTDTATGRTALAEAGDTTRGHTIADGRLLERPLQAFPSDAQGAGSIVSNLNDLTRWIALHLSHGETPAGRLLSRDLLEETYRPRVSVTDADFIRLVEMGPGRQDITYASGWIVHSLPEGRVIQHGGTTFGYNSAVMFDPDRQVGLVVLSNQGDQGGSATPIGKFGMDLLQGREPRDYFAETTVQREEAAAEAASAARERIDADTSTEHPLDWYSGVYEHPRLGRLEIRPDRDVLVTGVGPQEFDATGTRLTGSVFTFSWHVEGDPRAELTEMIATFDDSGASPDSVDMGGHVFERRR